jgi:hypothetical protein
MSGGPGSTSVERNTKKDFTPKQNEKIRFYRAESIVTKGRMPTLQACPTNPPQVKIIIQVSISMVK